MLDFWIEKNITYYLEIGLLNWCLHFRKDMYLFWKRFITCNQIEFVREEIFTVNLSLTMLVSSVSHRSMLWAVHIQKVWSNSILTKQVLV